MSLESLKKAVALADGQVALAIGIRACLPSSKVSQAHIWKWLNRAICEVPPCEYVIPICKALDWQITPNELRADLYPHPHDGLPADDPRRALQAAA
jgi:hypothetical protein